MVWNEGLLLTFHLEVARTDRAGPAGTEGVFLAPVVLILTDSRTRRHAIQELYLHETTQILSDICVVGAILGIVYNILAAILAPRFNRSSATEIFPPKPVTIMKPLHGSEPGLFLRLTSLCKQQHEGKIQLVCGTQRLIDPANDVVRLLQRLHPAKEIDLVVDDRTHGANPKVTNLVNMEAKARHEIIVLSDSDIMVDDGFVGRIVAELENPQTGAVTCLYYGIAGGGLWAQVSALNVNSQFLPNVIVALTFGAAKPCFGSAIAMRADVLKRIGGLKSYLDELADDYAIGRAVRATGLDVVVPHWAVGHVCFDRSFRSFWERHMRSSRTIRSIDPVGYIGTIFMHPAMLALIAALTGAQHPIALPGIAFASRAILSFSIERTFNLRPQALWLLALHDAISFAVFVCSFFSAAVEWRGQNYRILGEGTLEKDRSE
jgi:ceramide glucosyltransferase